MIQIICQQIFTVSKQAIAHGQDSFRRIYSIIQEYNSWQNTEDSISASLCTNALY